LKDFVDDRVSINL